MIWGEVLIDSLCGRADAGLKHCLKSSSFRLQKFVDLLLHSFLKTRVAEPVGTTVQAEHVCSRTAGACLALHGGGRACRRV